MSINFTQDFFTSRRNYADGNIRIGEPGRLWYDSITNTIRVGDDTPGGKVIASNDSQTFEYISKNLKSYPYVITYSNNALSSISYTTENGNIVKSFSYANNSLSSVSISGNILGNVILTKNLNYENGALISVFYSQSSI